MADTTPSSYFQKVHRRTTLRGTNPHAPRVALPSLTKPGAKRYEQIRNATASAPEARTAPRVTAVVADAPVASLKDDLERLRDEQIRQAKPKWWSGFVAHPVRSAIAAVMILALSGVLAVAGPVAWDAYQAYDKIFVTQAPVVGGGLDVELNAEGTPVIVSDPNATEIAAELPSWDGESRLTLLLLGVDRREGDYSRSDTIILVNIDPVEKTARMISIPRDLKLIVPGFGSQKINAAYAFGDANDNVPGGGPGLMMRTIEQNFGIDIDYYAEIDFNGFIEIVDTVGGVTLDVPYPIRDNEYPGPANQYMRIYFPAGWQHMDGTRALQYARTRHDDGDGRRSARQQQVLLALRQQALTLDLIGQAPTLITEVGDTVRTDLSPGQVLQLARLAMDIEQSQIQQMSLDGALYVYDGDEYFFQGDWLAIGEIMSEFTGETVIPPMSALANPRYDTPIRILDGTYNPGLGGRVLEVVQANGFSDSMTSDLVDLGNYPQSIISTSPDNQATAYLLAGILGLPESSIRITDEVAPTKPPIEETSTAGSDAGSPTPVDSAAEQPLFPTAEGGQDQAPASEIVIILGDDLPDPAWYEAPITDQ